MLDFVENNKEWLFSGAGITVITLIVLGARRIGRRGTSETPQIVVVHTAPTTTDSPESQRTGSLDESHRSRVPVRRVSALSLEEIRNNIEGALPLHRKQVSDSYVGINVEWDAKLSGADMDEDGFVELNLRVGDSAFNYVSCKASLGEYRELGVMPKGAKLRVSGKIAVVDNLWITLEDVELYFEQ